MNILHNPCIDGLQDFTRFVKPMSDLAHLSLFSATAQQILLSRKRTSLQWSRGLSESQYLEHCARLDKFEDAANGKLETW